MLVNVYSYIWSFTVTCVLYFAQLTNSNVLGKFIPICDSNISEIGNCSSKVELAKIQYTRDGEGPRRFMNKR
jgi:hypothetical protein